MKKIATILMASLFLQLPAMAGGRVPFKADFDTFFRLVGEVPPGTPPCGDVDLPPEAGAECIVTQIEGVGRASHMGVATIELSDVLIFNDGAPKATSNFVILTAANGDVLWGEYTDLPAPFDPATNTATISGPVRVVGGTGRFEEATGELQMIAVAFLSNGTATVALRGRISSVGSKPRRR